MKYPSRPTFIALSRSLLSGSRAEKAQAQASQANAAAAAGRAPVNRAEFEPSTQVRPFRADEMRAVVEKAQAQLGAGVRQAPPVAVAQDVRVVVAAPASARPPASAPAPAVAAAPAAKAKAAPPPAVPGRVLGLVVTALIILVSGLVLAFATTPARSAPPVAAAPPAEPAAPAAQPAQPEAPHAAAPAAADTGALVFTDPVVIDNAAATPTDKPADTKPAEAKPVDTKPAVAAADKPERADRPERSSRADKADRPEKSDRADRVAERPRVQAAADKPEKPAAEPKAPAGSGRELDELKRLEQLANSQLDKSMH